jgi:hypothetical protein
MRRLLIAVLALSAALIAAEIFLRWQESSIAAKEFLDPGLFQYDADLGWRLAPLARAHHVTADYDVNYTVDTDGFRSDSEASSDALIIGDSFAFGFGVGDNETFPCLLKCRNLGVPGYSTDQELILFEKNLPMLKPRRVFLVVCLINDLFDNAMPFPIQAPRAKPFFKMEGAQLVVQNTPVPREEHDVNAGYSLADVVAGGRAPWWQHSRLASALWRDQRPHDFSAYATLFRAIAQRMQARCVLNGIDFKIVLLPGQSLVKDPSSPSGAYQDALRREILSTDLPVVDATPALSANDYFPHDGHLNSGGHVMMAKFILGL